MTRAQALNDFCYEDAMLERRNEDAARLERLRKEERRDSLKQWAGAFAIAAVVAFLLKIVEAI